MRWRFDAVNAQLGDTGTQVAVTNEDGSDTMEILRLKVANGAVTEMEIIRCAKACAGDAWWGPEQLDKEPSAFLKLPIPHRGPQDSSWQPCLEAPYGWYYLPDRLKVDDDGRVWMSCHDGIIVSSPGLLPAR